MRALREPLLVLICEPDEARREEVRAWLGSAGFLTGEDARGIRTGREPSPDVVLFGLGPDPTADLRSMALIQAAAPRARIVVLHAPGQERTVLEAMRRGAWADICREAVEAEKVVTTVHLVAGGKAVISPRIGGLMLDAVQRRRPEAERTGNPEGGSKGTGYPR